MRDLNVDFEICNKAYCGPWTHNEYWRVENPETIASGGSICRAFCENNAAFIAAARTGWPEAIERAIKAEEELEKQIKYHVERTDEHTEIINRLNQRKKEIYEKASELREENDLQRHSIHQLSAQVAAYRKVIIDCPIEAQDGCNCPDCKAVRNCENILYTQPNPCADLLAKMEKMEAVAEAARKLISNYWNNRVNGILAEKLQQALAALAALEGSADE